MSNATPVVKWQQVFADQPVAKLVWKPVTSSAMSQQKPIANVKPQVRRHNHVGDADPRLQLQEQSTQEHVLDEVQSSLDGSDDPEYHTQIPHPYENYHPDRLRRLRRALIEHEARNAEERAQRQRQVQEGAAIANQPDVQIVGRGRGRGVFPRTLSRLETLRHFSSS